MADATSDFSQWLRSTLSCVAELSLHKALHTVSCLALRDYCASIWFVKIYGPRWSFFAGHVASMPADQDLQLIKLKFNFGMVCGSPGELKSPALELLIIFINDLLTERVSNCSATIEPPGFQGDEMVS